MPMHPAIERVTSRITDRSRRLRDDYLARMDAARETGPSRRELSAKSSRPEAAPT